MPTRQSQKSSTHISKRSQKPFHLTQSGPLKEFYRFGPTPKGLVQWALSWVKKSEYPITPDPPWGLLGDTKLSADDWLALGKEIGFLWEVTQRSPEHWSDSLNAALAKFTQKNLLITLPNKPQTLHFVSTLGELFRVLVYHPFAEVGPLSIKFWVNRKDPPRETVNNPWMTNVAGTSTSPPAADPNFVDQMIFKVVQALQTCGGMVNKCRECSTLFLAEKISQVYCSVRCQSRVTSREYYRLKAMKNSQTKSQKPKKRVPQKGTR